MTLPLPGMGMVGGIMKMCPPFPLLPAAALAGAFLVQPFNGALKAGPAPAADTNANAAAEAGNSGLNALLRDALFEEEATRDLTKAAAGYEALLAQWAAQRPTAAAALYRLAEVRRKQDRKPDAIALYQRLLREFPDVEPHAKLARENLTALGAKELSPLTAAEALQKGIWPGAPDRLISAEETAALQRIKKLAVESPDLLIGDESRTACEKGWLTVVQFLLNQNIDCDIEGYRIAAANGHLAIIRELLKHKPHPAGLAEAVTGAVKKNRLTVLKTLLEAGASPEGGNPEEPALTIALSKGYSDAATLLLDHKASADPEKASVSPLFTAARLQHAPFVQRLLELKADPNRATRRPANADPDMVPRDVLIDPFGTTPLHAAVATGNAEIVKLLLDAKANPNAKNDAGWTPLLGAMDHQNLPIVEQLLAAGADPNLANNQNETPLLRAVKRRQCEIAAALLKAKADPNALCDPEDKMSVFAYALIGGDPEGDPMVTLFLEHGADPFLPAAPPIWVAPAEWRIKILRSHKYPALAGTPAVTLVYGNEIRLSTLVERKEDSEKPGTLPALLTMWNVKGGWSLPENQILIQQPDWSTLRLWRKGTDGKMQETVIEVKKDTAWPELQWGDVVEVLALPDDTSASKSKSPRRVELRPDGSTAPSPAIPAETLELLKPAK